MNAISKDNTHLDTAGSKLAALNDWVASVARLTQPGAIH